MKRTFWYFMKICVSLGLATACVEGTVGEKGEEGGPMALGLDEVAELISSLPIGNEQMSEVFAAVSSSSGNGFDEEYMMRDLFEVPGRGVGDEYVETKAAVSYEKPMRELIRESLVSRTKAAGRPDLPDVDPEAFMDGLAESDIQIYWPYSGNWDKASLPIITYAPGDDSRETNVGYRLYYDRDGNIAKEKLLVDEQMAVETPVWVINRNDDSGLRPLELIRKNDPGWGMPGGDITIETKANPGPQGTVRTLILKNFQMNRNYDCWFAGASEFFVKIGSVEDFWASTEAEMRVFTPTVTDFNIVVKRSQKGEPVPFNAVLVSEWTEQLEKCAFIITEDDGGTIDAWKCSAVVKYGSKNYGIDISIPIYSKDDIVWRGQLSRKFIEVNSNAVGHFGDVDLTFQITSTNY
ncbi:MAG: hypothetical protein MJY56_00370 [Bacteroidales bacterium]|nr:hypothetical protein [Bacteroidales bacterium]